MSFQAANIDEFGRDLSLKTSSKNREAATAFIAEITVLLENERKLEEAYRTASDFMADLRTKYAGMSWAEITFAEEEEEEEEERIRVRERNRKDDQKRYHLYVIGEYEPEEGEIFE